MIDTPEIRKMYLDLLRKHLTRFGDDDLVAVHAANRPLVRRVLNMLAKRNIKLVREVPFDERKRTLGLDWPGAAESMIGMQRLTSLQHCAETVLAENIPGDLVECGVWRGGACILMRAVLAAYGDENRNVWVTDSFAGVPPPDKEKYPADENLRLDLQSYVLAVSESTVRNNFERYGLLDDRVRFLVGWFKDTLRDAPIDHISLLRLDGDLYESTSQALNALYPRLSNGGFCIIDDYHAINACRQAVTDYRKQHDAFGQIIEIDGTGVFWRKLLSNMPLSGLRAEMTQQSTQRPTPHRPIRFAQPRGETGRVRMTEAAIRVSHCRVCGANDWVPVVVSFGPMPRTAFADGLQDTVAWYAGNRDWWEPLKRPAGPRTEAELATSKGQAR